MGCSPSKGNNFGSLGPLRKSRMLPPPPQESPRDRLSEDETNCNLPGSTDRDMKERKLAGQSRIPQKEVHFTPQKKKPVPDLTPQAMNMENTTLAQRKDKAGEKQEGAEKKLGKKSKKNTRSAKALKKKEKDLDKPHLEQKVDFPEPLVKAHQAAYAFLNPSINKYDSLMELLEQATQTQVLVQPMVAFMALRYEEIIQGLEEMAGEGEKVLKEYGEHLAWPSQMKNLSSSALKSGPVNVEPPPDLLQQLLQYTTQRMQNVSHSVGKLGDSALEETLEYFASVSELLEEKLKVKRAVETRLMQLLCRIEMASLRKPGPEDSALFSEDSGIGAESESLAGSDRQQRPDSCGSTGTNRTFVSPTGYNSFKIRRTASRRMFTSQVSPSVSLTSLNSVASTCTILANEQIDSLLGYVSCEDDNEGDVEMKDKQINFRSRSISVDSELPRRIPPKRIENPQNIEMTLKMKNAISGRIQFAKSKISDSPKTSRRQWSDDKEQTSKRPQTAAPKAVVKKTTVTKERRSQSAESLRSKGEDATLLELDRTQKDLNQRLQKMAKNKGVPHAKTAPCKQNQKTPAIQSQKLNHKNVALQNVQTTGNKIGLVKRSSKKQEAIHLEEDNKAKDNSSDNDTMKATMPPTPPSSPRPSSGLSRGRNSVKKLIDTFSQGIEEREGPKVLGPLRGVKKCGVPVMPGLGNVEAVLNSGITSCRPESELDKTDYLDLESLPPPPLEVLMDNSFESARSLATGVADDGATKVCKSPLSKRAMVSQRLKASVHPVTVLPSKGGLLQTSKSSFTKPDNQETSAPLKVSQPEPPLKENDSLCQQARRIINLRNSHSEKQSGCVATDPSVSQDKSTEVEDSANTTVPGPNTTVFVVPPSAIRSQPLATTPVSRTRMLPSTPTTPSCLHRRLPSPHNLKRQPTPPSSGSPVNSTPTLLQRRLPSPPVAKQNNSKANSVSSYPFKAPSPPASPKVQRWSRENSREDLCSARKINNARSVFCPASSSLFEAPPCPIPQLPEAWTSTRVSFLSRMWGGHGHFPVAVQGPRPFIRRSQSDRRPSLNLPPRSPGVSFAETCGSEPMIYSQGLDGEPREEDFWGSQSDLRATPRSASHPDLCVVGQSLHTD